MAIEYNATITLDTRNDVDELLLDALRRYHPATGRSPLGNVQVTITVSGEDIVQVLQTSVAVIARELRAPVLGADIMTTEEFDRRQGLEPVPELLSVVEAAARLGITRQAVLQRIEAGTLAATRVGKTWAVPATAVDTLIASTRGLAEHAASRQDAETLAHKTPTM